MIALAETDANNKFFNTVESVFTKKIYT